MAESKNCCEVCMNLAYDPELDEYYCALELGLDMYDYERSLSGNFQSCPFFKFGDEYNIVRKQN